MKFSEIVSNFQIAKKKSDRDIAKALNVAHGTVQGWKNGVLPITQNNYQTLKICNYFKITPNQLYGFSSKNKQAESIKSVVSSIDAVVWQKLANFHEAKNHNELAFVFRALANALLLSDDKPLKVYVKRYSGKIDNQLRLF